MPLLFSYGTLQREEVQRATLGRRLDGARDELPGFAPARVPIHDPVVAASAGTTHHANVTPTGDERHRVPGMAFEVSESELAGIDRYESAFDYRRRTVTLASGRQAWVYVHAPPPPGDVSA